MKGMKIKNKVATFTKTTLAIALVSPLVASAQSTEQIKYTGELTSLMPKVSVGISETPTAFVEDVKLTIDENGVHCRLTTSMQDFNYSYKAGGTPVCLFEWVGDGKGIVLDGLKSEGVLNQADEVEFKYTVSVMNGGEKKTILEDSFVANVITPTDSVITGIDSKIGTQDVDGFEFDNYDRRRGISRVTINVEEKTFEQVVSLMGKTCKVPEGETSCRVDIGNLIPGVEDETLVGTESLAVSALDTKDYLTPSNQDIVINFDYRPPTVVEFVMNGSAKTESITHTVDGTDFELGVNEGILVLQTFHSAKEGDWWVPQIESFELVPEVAVDALGGEITINERVVRIPQLLTSYRDKYNVSPSSEAIMVGDKVVFKMNLMSLPDGRYNINAIVSDEYENMSTSDTIQKLIDRNSPNLLAIFGGDVIRTNDPIVPVFLSDMHFFVSSGWDDGAELKSVKMDGTDFAYDSLGNGLFRMKESDDLVSGQRYVMSVIAADSSGNEVTNDYEVVYSDAQFQLFTKSDSVYAEVQNNDIRMTQRGGQRCKFTSSIELAKEISKGNSKGCTIETSRIPVGLNVELDGRGISLDGAIENVGLHDISFDVVYHNHDGQTKTFSSDVVTIEALEAEGVTIELLDRNKISDGLYSIPFNSRYSTEFMINYFNADVDLGISAGGNTEESVLRQARRTQELNRKVRIKRVDGGDLPVWSTVIYDIDANYTRKPEQVVKESFDVVITPASYTKAFLEIEDTGEVLTDDTINLQGFVGTIDRQTKEVVYIPEEMGDWEAMLAVRQDKDYVPISEPVDIDANGKVKFSISGQTLFDTSRQFYMIANAKSPIDGFDMQIRSRSTFLEVLKAGQVEGSIRARNLESKIPFDVSLNFSFDERADEDVSGNFYWQVSADGETWQDVETQINKPRYNVSVQEVSRKSYRVKLTNRVSGVESFSEVVSVVGYDVADIELNGPTSVFSGLSATFDAEVSDLLAGDSDGVFEWSVNGGETWGYGTNSFTLVPTESFEVAVRYRLNTSEGIDDEGVYSSQEMSVVVREPRPLSVSFGVPRVMEVGYEGSLEGRYREPLRGFDGTIIEMITLPDGTEVNASSIKYTPISEDIENGKASFTYTAWVDGLENETKASETREINIFDYEFNMPTLDVRNRYSIAPTSVYASVFLNTENESPDIEFEYDWLLEKADGFEVIRDNNDRVNFNILESGTKMVGVHVSDNRGNEAEVSQVVEITEALPMTIELSPRYSKSMITAPIGVTMLANYTFDHPQDYPITLKWYIDGEMVSETTSDRNFYEITEPGTKEIKVVLDSAFGQQGEATFNVSVAPNVPPECNPSVDDRGTKIVVSPNCSDTDGNIVQTYYSWAGQDELQGYSRINFNKSEYPSLTLTIRSVDDGGEETSATINW